MLRAVRLYFRPHSSLTQGRKLQERATRIEEHVDALSGEELPPPPQPLDGSVSPSFADGIELRVELLEEVGGVYVRLVELGLIGY